MNPEKNPRPKTRTELLHNLDLIEHLPFKGVHDMFTYQLLVFSNCPKVTLILLGVQSTVWFGDEGGQSKRHLYK